MGTKVEEDDDRKLLTFDEAVALLPDGDDIHTFDNSAGLLLGCDLRRERVLQLLREGEPERAGGMAKSMGHGIALLGNGRRLFIQTRKAKGGE